MRYEELSKPLYHGTIVPFSKIDLSMGAPKKDFGRGFYTTNDFGQACKFASLKARREHLNRGCVLTFALSDIENLAITRFPETNEEWFDFILCNRSHGQYARFHDERVFDIVIGPVANDAVGVVLNNFIDGVYGDAGSLEAKDTAIRLLLSQKLHNQIFFGTDRAVSGLSLEGTEVVYIDG